MKKNELPSMQELLNGRIDHRKEKRYFRKMGQDDPLYIAWVAFLCRRLCLTETTANQPLSSRQASCRMGSWLQREIVAMSCQEACWWEQKFMATEWQLAILFGSSWISEWDDAYLNNGMWE